MDQERLRRDGGYLAAMKRSIAAVDGRTPSWCPCTPCAERLAAFNRPRVTALAERIVSPSSMKTALYVAGLGCRQNCSPDELEQLLLQALEFRALPLGALDYLASSEHKRNEAGLIQLAERLGIPLVWLSASQLGHYDAVLSGHSALSRRVTGSAGVAEASALAQAEVVTGQRARLLCHKLRSSNATCALATAPFFEPLESA